MREWHVYLVATGGDFPALDRLACCVGLPRSTVFRYCLKLSLPLSRENGRV